MEDRLLDEEKRMIISQALWDLNLSPEEFMGIIEGRIVRKWPDRGFCIARFLESVNWFDVTKVIPPGDICRLKDGLDLKRALLDAESKAAGIAPSL